MFLLLLLDNSFFYNPSLSRLLSIFRETSVVNSHQFICYPVSPQLLFAKLFCRLKSNDFFSSFLLQPNRNKTFFLVSRNFMPDELNTPWSLSLSVAENGLC